jgi:hypothetical protein
VAAAVVGALLLTVAALTVLGTDGPVSIGAGDAGEEESGTEPEAGSMAQITFRGPLRREGDVWVVDAEPNMAIAPPGGPVGVPQATEGVTYTGRVEAECRTTDDRREFLERHEGGVIVMRSVGDDYDIGDSSPLTLSGRWDLLSDECASDDSDS